MGIASNQRAERFTTLPRRQGRIRSVVREAKHLYQVERVGESEWTPWIAILGLILFFTAVALLMLGITEAALYLLVSASFGV